MKDLLEIRGGRVFDSKRRKLGLSFDFFCYIKRDYLHKQPITKRLRREVLENYGFKCYCCGVVLTGEGSDTHIHHLIAEHLGGKTDLDNLRPLCLSCHQSLHESRGFEYWKKPEWRKKSLEICHKKIMHDNG